MSRSTDTVADTDPLAPRTELWKATCDRCGFTTVVRRGRNFVEKAMAGWLILNQEVGHGFSVLGEYCKECAPAILRAILATKTEAPPPPKDKGGYRW